MTLEEIYYISQIVASLAVLASLIYLALQTRQSARTSKAAMHENRMSTILHHVDQTTNPAFHPIWVKGLRAEADLTDAEIGRFQAQVSAWIIVWEERFRQKREGMLSEDRWKASERAISSMTTQPGFRAAVALMRPRLDPDFGAIIDKHVALGRAAPAIDGAAVWRAAAGTELAARTGPKIEPPPMIER